jgi:4'-phosphopantetheinyl transferase
MCGASDSPAGADSWTVPGADFAPELIEGEVHVWRARLDVDEKKLADFEALLSPDEHERAARFRFDEHRRRYVAARGFLRKILGGYLRCDPALLVFDYGKHGKPVLASPANSRVEFNVSHSADLALFAFASGRSVGVDVELIKPGVSCMEIAEHHFSENEIALLRSLTEPAMCEKFFEMWSEKEARLKALGVGLQFALIEQRAGEPPWSVVELKPAPGFAAAVAVQGSVARVVRFCAA